MHRSTTGTLLEWMRDRFAPLFSHAFVVARDPSRFHGLGLPVVVDALPEDGSAVGVYTAVLAAPTERVICLACDMPFVTPRFLRTLAEKSKGYDVFVPRHGEYLQPLCAVYGKGTLDAYRRVHPLREAGASSTSIPDLNTGYLDMDDGSYGDPEALFMNVNTPAELEAARQRLAAEEGGWRAALQPRIQAFMDTCPLPIVSFIGKKKSGKTTVVLGVIKELRSRGYRVAALKHDTHGFEVDVPGTDSYRFREVGAEVVGISSPDKYVWLNTVQEERSAGRSRPPDPRAGGPGHHRRLQEAGRSQDRGVAPGAQHRAGEHRRRTHRYHERPAVPGLSRSRSSHSTTSRDWPTSSKSVYSYEYNASSVRRSEKRPARESASRAERRLPASFRHR